MNCDHRPPLPIDIDYNSPCPLCTLEKRVDELAMSLLGLRQEILDSTAKAEDVPVKQEEKLYSGFTLKEWELMFRDGPLLLEYWNGDRTGWFDRAVPGVTGIRFYSDTSRLGETESNFHCVVRLIEQPNWRPHRTDEMPVPGRVKAEIEYWTGGRYSGKAEVPRWDKGNIRAYRIIGLEDK